MTHVAIERDVWRELWSAGGRCRVAGIAYKTIVQPGFQLAE